MLYCFYKIVLFFLFFSLPSLLSPSLALFRLLISPFLALERSKVDMEEPETNSKRIGSLKDTPYDC